MLGLFERIGEGLEMISLPISGMVAKAKCEVANAIVDIKTDAKVRKYQKKRLAAGYTLDDDEDDEEEFDEETLSVENDKNMYNRFGVKKAFYGRGGLGKGSGMLVADSEK